MYTFFEDIMKNDSFYLDLAKPNVFFFLWKCFYTVSALKNLFFILKGCIAVFTHKYIPSSQVSIVEKLFLWLLFFLRGFKAFLLLFFFWKLFSPFYLRLQTKGVSSGRKEIYRKIVLSSHGLFFSSSYRPDFHPFFRWIIIQ